MTDHFEEIRAVLLPAFKRMFEEAMAELLDLPPDCFAFRAALVEGIEDRGWLIAVDDLWESELERRLGVENALEALFSGKDDALVGQLSAAVCEAAAAGGWTILPPSGSAEPDPICYVDSDLDLPAIQAFFNEATHGEAPPNPEDPRSAPWYNKIAAGLVRNLAFIRRRPAVEPLRASLEAALNLTGILRNPPLPGAVQDLVLRISPLLKNGESMDTAALVNDLSRLIEKYRDCDAETGADEIARALILKRGWRLLYHG